LLGKLLRPAILVEKGAIQVSNNVAYYSCTDPKHKKDRSSEAE